MWDFTVARASFAYLTVKMAASSTARPKQTISDPYIHIHTHTCLYIYVCPLTGNACFIF